MSSRILLDDMHAYMRVFNKKKKNLGKNVAFY